MRVCRPRQPGDLIAEVARALDHDQVLGLVGPNDDEAVLAVDEPVDDPDAAFVVATSGSSVRKAVVLSRPAVLAGAAATQEFLGGPTDWACPLPVHHIAGLMTLVRAHAAGTRVIPIDPHLTELRAPVRPTVISVVPTQLVRALRDEAVTEALAAHHAVLVGGAASNPALIEQARDAGIRAITTYGMSETCGGCVYDGQPLPGVEVRIEDDQRIVLAGPMVFSGYRLAPALTAEVLIDGAVRTNDRGRWRDGRVEVLGRLDDVIISGGVNVDLAEVQRAVDAQRVAGHDTVVVGVPDGEWGSVVTLVTTGDPDLSGWRDRLGTVLPHTWLPRRVVRVDSLPLTSSGKVDRQGLIGRLSIQSSEV